jgi:hypothetical protein
VLAAECGKAPTSACPRPRSHAGVPGHVAALRHRGRPPPEDIATGLDALQSCGRPEGQIIARPALLPVEAGLAALPALRVSSSDAGRLVRGQRC